MQWLIDMVIEAIGVPPVFVDRGDPAISDWQMPFLDNDSSWHDLDVSGVVPAEASAILFGVKLVGATVVDMIELRKSGNSNDKANNICANSVALLPAYEDLVVATSDNGEVEYKITLDTISVDLTVKGWWL